MTYMYHDSREEAPAAVSGFEKLLEELQPGDCMVVERLSGAAKDGASLLKLLEESPRHGYEVIRLLQDRFLGVYSPSPGTIYPRLARLESEGLVTHEVVKGKKVYSLTDKGREELERRMDELAELFTADAEFHCRTDSGETPYEEFVTADLSGRDEVMAWQRQHRADSPYPLRHHGTNFIVTERSAGQLRFSSYLFVTQVESVLPVGVSSAVVNGTIRVEGDELRLSEMQLVLDMTESVPFKDRA